MSERDYAKSIIDIIPEEHLGDVIEYMLSLSDSEYDEEKFKLVSKHILEKYHKAFEELGFSLISNHAFIDGNKRIGMYVMLAFLEMNGIHISPSDDDIIHLGLDVASGNAGYENILDWIKGFEKQ